MSDGLEVYAVDEVHQRFCIKLYSDLSLPIFDGMELAPSKQVSYLFGLPRLHRAKSLCLS